MKRAVLFILFVLLTISIPVFAGGMDDEGQPNDPRVNENANACYEGGSMGHYYCDEEEEWIGGWYLIRYENGMITRDQVPDFVSWILPPLDDDDDDDDTDAGQCYIQIEEDFVNNKHVVEKVSDAVLNGANEGTFKWSSPTLLISVYSNWALWNDGIWEVHYYGDCGALGVGDPLPTDGSVIVYPGVDPFQCYIQVGEDFVNSIHIVEHASATVLGGGNEGSFSWSGTQLISSYSGWLVYDSAATPAWAVNYWGDCAPLGSGVKLPFEIIIVP